MAKAKYITEFEREIMRIGYAKGFKAPQIARALGRGKMVVYNHLKQMEDDGTLHNLPMCFVVDDVAEMIRRAAMK